MKVIFLDFDGVLSNYRKELIFDLAKINLIIRLASSTGAKIVVTSSWKGDYPNLEAFKRALPSLITGRRTNVPMMNATLFANMVFDITDPTIPERGGQIQQWLDDHHEVTSYVIIDDNHSNVLHSQILNFVQTDCIEGLTEREYYIAEEVLDRRGASKYPHRQNNLLMYNYMKNFFRLN